MTHQTQSRSACYTYCLGSTSVFTFFRARAIADLPLKLQPGASVDRIDGWETDVEGRPVLKVRVRARPVDGEANEAVTRFLAKALGVSRSSVTVKRGGQSRLKMIAVEGLDDHALRDRIDALVTRG